MKLTAKVGLLWDKQKVSLALTTSQPSVLLSHFSTILAYLQPPVHSRTLLLHLKSVVGGRCHMVRPSTTMISILVLCWSLNWSPCLPVTSLSTCFLPSVSTSQSTSSGPVSGGSWPSTPSCTWAVCLSSSASPSSCWAPGTTCRLSTASCEFHHIVTSAECVFGVALF